MDKDLAISELLIRLTDLTRLIEVHAEEITVLRKENSHLRERLARFANPKNSRNSSIPRQGTRTGRRRTKAFGGLPTGSPAGSPAIRGTP